jgi:hypothetical protein
MAAGRRSAETSHLGRLRVWASADTLSWVGWLRNTTGLNASRVVENAVQLYAFAEAERSAGRKLLTMNADGTDVREIK